MREIETFEEFRLHLHFATLIVCVRWFGQLAFGACIAEEEENYTVENCE
jgi:hypothetical protein